MKYYILILGFFGLFLLAGCNSTNPNDTYNTGKTIQTQTGIQKNKEIKEIPNDPKPKKLIDITTNFLNEDTIEIKGDLSNKFQSGEINKIGIISCEDNLKLDYDNEEYFLEKYKYPNFSYFISPKFNNLCNTQYKINFYKDDNLITQNKIKLEEDVINIIRSNGYNYGEGLNFHEGFESPFGGILELKGNFLIKKELDKEYFKGLSDKTCQADKALRGTKKCPTINALFFQSQKPTKAYYELNSPIYQGNYKSIEKQKNNISGENNLIRLGCINNNLDNFDIFFNDLTKGYCKDDKCINKYPYSSKEDFETIIQNTKNKEEITAKFYKVPYKSISKGGRGYSQCETQFSKIEIIK